MQAQYELLSQMAKSGQTLNVLQDFFVKFYQAFIVADRWQQYIKGVGTTLMASPACRTRLKQSVACAHFPSARSRA